MSWEFEEAALGKAYDWRLIRRFARYVRPYRRWLVLIFLLLAVSVAASLAGPWIIKNAVDGPITAGLRADDKAPHLAALGRWALLYLGVVLIELATVYLRMLTVRKTAQAAISDLRCHLYSHVTSLDMRFFDTQPVGRLVVRTTNDLQALTELFSAGFVMIVHDMFVLVGVVVMMLLASPAMTLVAFCVMPPIVFTALMFRRKARGAFRDYRLHLARVNSFINENVLGIRVVQLFHRESLQGERLGERNEETLKAQLKGVFYFALFFPSIEVLVALATAGIVIFAADAVLAAALTLGNFYLFWRLLWRFFRPIIALADRYTVLQRAMASAERVFRLLDTKNPLTFPDNGYAPKKALGAAAVEGLRFSYDGRRTVLFDVDFAVSPGERVAVVGPTGAGKTSLINMLCHFYEPQKGRVLLDGRDVREWNNAALRRNVALVPQDFFVFAGSLRDNIRLWDERIGEADLERATDAARLRKLAERLPDGLDSELTERGSTLSVGERQLLSFARAFARDPAVVILDEATSSVDSETEALVQEALDRLLSGRTAVIIAHRLSTIRNCDRIVVLKEGRVAEEGSHAELMRKRGLYWLLYQTQYKWQEGSEQTTASARPPPPRDRP